MYVLLQDHRLFLVALVCCLTLTAPASSYAKPRANGFMFVSCGGKHTWCFEHDGYKYRNGTLYNITKQEGEYVWIVDHEGKIRKFKFAEPARYGPPRLVHVRHISSYYVGRARWYDTAWDFENNRPVIDRSDQYFRRYYHWWLVALGKYFLYTQLGFVALLSFYFWIAGKGRYERMTESGIKDANEAREFCVWTLICTGVILSVGGLPGSMYSDTVDKYEELYRYLDTQRLPSGWFLPLDRSVVIQHSAWYSPVSSLYMLVFGGLHLIIVPWVLLRSVSFAKGLHYLFVPHPAAEVVKGSKGEVSDHKALAETIERSDLVSESKMPMVFVSENMKRKAKKLAALTRRRTAEKKLLEEHEQFSREEEALRDKERRDE